MRTVRSRDGTRIAFDTVGNGPPLILVGGAFSFRMYKGLVELSGLLANNFTVFNYDRRGRGDSGDTPPYSVDREFEDLEALVAEAGGSAHVWGLSSGATLALRAAARGLAIRKLALFEPPFFIDREDHVPPNDLETHLDRLIADGRRGEAVKYFITKGLGAPPIAIFFMRLMPGVWPRLTAVAHTLPYDTRIVGSAIGGVPIRPEEWAAVGVRTLVISGEKSPSRLRRGSAALAKALPRADHRRLKGQSYDVSMKVLAPVLVEFFLSP
jgi:pimeloyl-ACP methyl ester carboxylesterase